MELGMWSSCLQNSPKFLKSQNKLTNPAEALRHPQQCSVYGPVKVIFRDKCSYLLFCNPTHKNEPGTANRLGTTNSKPPGPIIMMFNEKPL
jgi:hypothetical protein